MSKSITAALVSITYSLHREAHDEFDCAAQDTDAVDDHYQEMAVAGQVITDLRRNGLTIAKLRSDAGRRKPR